MSVKVKLPDGITRQDWLDPATYPPPKGMKLFLLTFGGCAIVGQWDAANCKGWLPLPNTPKELRGMTWTIEN